MKSTRQQFTDRRSFQEYMSQQGYGVRVDCSASAYQWVLERYDLRTALLAEFCQTRSAPMPCDTVHYLTDPDGTFVIGLDCPNHPLTPGEVFFREIKDRCAFGRDLTRAGLTNALASDNRRPDREVA